jgi:hypothetical protein
MKFRIIKRKRVTKLFRFLGSRAFIGSLLFAMALWVYANLQNENTVATIKLPLTVVLPPNRAIENQIKPEVYVQVKGMGWALFNLIFFNSSARCYVDLSRENIQSTNYEISRNDLLRSLQALSNVQAIDVYPQNLLIQTGKVGEYAVPVRSIVKIIPREGFGIIGDVVIKPDIIVIRGNERTVSKIESWATKPVILSDVYDSLNIQIPLSDSLANIVSLSQPTVTLVADIEQIAEITIPDVKLNIRGGTLSENHKIIPAQVSITVRGGIGRIESLTPESITASLDYTQVIDDSTGIIMPKISVPENIKVLQVDPPYLHHVRVVH